jgi:hypothetical protein
MWDIYRITIEDIIAIHVVGAVIALIVWAIRSIRDHFKPEY